ncbi:hypothetical protein QJS66_03245 [Kocuria rhizophila]|nr:hypothetical protein QJS66_03245 [Kocuria rhizophila]
MARHPRGRPRRRAVRIGTGITGAAPGAKIQPVRVLGKCTNGGSRTSPTPWPGQPGPGGRRAREPEPRPRSSTCPDHPGSACHHENAMNTAGELVRAGGGRRRQRAINAGGTAPANCANTIVVGAADNNGNTASYSNTGAVVVRAGTGRHQPVPHALHGQLGHTRTGGRHVRQHDGHLHGHPAVSGTAAR